MKTHMAWQRILFITLLISLAGLTACSAISTTHSLKDAQQSFSTAARLENQQKLATLSSTTIQSGLPAIGSTAISAAYAATVDNLSKIDTKELEKNGLLGNAYALKAMSYWRLQKYPLALDYQQRALRLNNQKNNKLGDRDLLMMTILPSLIANDQARQQILALRSHQPTDVTLPDILNSLTQSMNTLQHTAQGIPADHPLHTYLMVSRLGAFATYKNACDLKQRDKDKINCISAQVCPAKTSYDKLPGTLKTSFRPLFTGYLGKQCPNK